MAKVRHHLICTLAAGLFTFACQADTVSNPDVLWLARQRADAVSCVSNLKQIGLAARLWENDNGSFPPGFNVLTNELVDPRILFCPARYRREGTPTNWENFAWSSIDYEWIAPTNACDSYEIFCRCKIHNNVGREDGSGEVIPGYRIGWPRIVSSLVSQIASTGSITRFDFVMTNAAAPYRVQWNREDPFGVQTVFLS